MTDKIAPQSCWDDQSPDLALRMSTLPAEDDSKRYPDLIDEFTSYRSRFGDAESAFRLKDYMLDVLACCGASFPNVGQSAILIARKTKIGASSEQQSAAINAAWEFLRENDLEYNFLDQRALGIRAALCVPALNLQTQSIDELIFWFFNFIDGIDGCCALDAPQKFTKHFSSHDAKDQH